MCSKYLVIFRTARKTSLRFPWEGQIDITGVVAGLLSLLLLLLLLLRSVVAVSLLSSCYNYQCCY